MASDDAMLPVELPVAIPPPPRRPAARPAKPTRPARQRAATLPVARVCVDVSLPHLDRPFDYLVPAEAADTAVPGCRVRVRFAGQRVDGYLLERVAETDFTGRLEFLERVVSPEPVLTPEIQRLARAVADRYGGTLADVLRLAVPPRHARAEGRPTAARPGATAAATAASTAIPATTAQSRPTVTADAAPASPRDAPDEPESRTDAAAGPADGPSADPGSADPAAPLADTGSADPAAPLDDGASADPAALADDGSADPTTPLADGASVDRAAPLADAESTHPAALDDGGSADRAAPLGDGASDDPAAPLDDAAAGERAALPDDAGWRDYPAGPAFLRALADGRAPRTVLTLAPGEDWPARLAEALVTATASGRGAVAVVPDARDLDRLDAAVTALVGADTHVALSAALGPAERYRRYLRAARGQVRLVLGTRAAMFAPVERLGLLAIWDDGDDLHSDDHAPYPHARDVLLTRAQMCEGAMLVAGYARSAEAQLLVATGWAREIVADRAALRRRAPQVLPTGDEFQIARDPAGAAARLPSSAAEAARTALGAGAPVLVQVPRRGYLPVVVCQQCRARTRCPHCSGPLSIPDSGGFPVCRWCGRAAAGWQCPECGGRRLRAAVIGARRTAEELGRAFPGATVRTSGRDGVLTAVEAGPTLVVATPGAEPVAAGGYGAVLLLDAWALLTRADLRAAEETLRRWLAAAVLARPAADGGKVVVVADPALPTVQALVRFDAAGFAERELADRRELGFPPAVRMASLTGTSTGIAALLAGAELPEGTDQLGPVPVGRPGADGAESERLLLRVARARAPELAAALHVAMAARSARKEPDPVRVQVDPLDLL